MRQLLILKLKVQMKKLYILGFIIPFCLSAGILKAQLSGTYTVGGTSPDYATISDAVAALNNVSNNITGPVHLIFAPMFMMRDKYLLQEKHLTW